MEIGSDGVEARADHEVRSQAALVGVALRVRPFRRIVVAVIHRNGRSTPATKHGSKASDPASAMHDCDRAASLDEARRKEGRENERQRGEKEKIKSTTQAS